MCYGSPLFSAHRQPVRWDSPTTLAGCPNCWGVDSMKRDKSYYRCQRKKHIQRKLGILKRTGGENFVRGWSHGQPGRLSKGKIHCSCWMCRTKSYDEPSRRDKRRCSATKQQEAEFLEVLSQYDRNSKNRVENADTKVRE